MRISLETRASIAKLARNGHSKAAIMRMLNVGRKAVDRWWDEDATDVQNFLDLPRSGRPSKLQPPLVKAIRRMASPKATCCSISTRLRRSKKADLHRTTVGKVLKGGKRPLVWRPVVMSRRLSSSNRAARLVFCSDHKPAPRAPWVFVDGKMLSLYSDRHGSLSHAWQSLNKPLTKGSGKLVATFHFYAAVARGFKSQLYFVPPSWEGGTAPKSAQTFKGPSYVGVMRRLQKELELWGPSKGTYHIIRDKARQHTSASTVQALAPLKLPILESFPAQSWDVNCIEHVWAQLAQKVRGRRPRTPAGFKAVILKEWGAIPQSTIDLLVAGVPKRILRIAEGGGAWIADYQV